jgi:hypothetical protein
MTTTVNVPYLYRVRASACQPGFSRYTSHPTYGIDSRKAAGQVLARAHAVRAWCADYSSYDLLPSPGENARIRFTDAAGIGSSQRGCAFSG